MKKGFNRLRGVATASAISLGLMGAGSGRAATLTLPVTKLSRGSAEWSQINNTFLNTVSGPSFIATTNGIVITSNGTGFAINDAGLTNGLDEAFNAGMYMVARSSGITAVFKNPDSTVDLTNDSLKSDLITDFFTDIDTQVEYYFHPTRPVVRAMYSFTNTSGSAKTIEVMIGGNLGSAVSTTIQSTSDDDTTVEATDLWLISNNKSLNTNPDESDLNDTPVVTISRFGTDATTTAENGITLGTLSGIFAHRYDISVAGNSTARVLVFAELSKTIDDAKTCAKDFETLDTASSAGLLSGLTIQLDEIVNYDVATGSTISSACIHTGGSGSGSSSGGSSTEDDKIESTGAISLTSTTALISLLGLVRLRRIIKDNDNNSVS